LLRILLNTFLHVLLRGLVHGTREFAGWHCTPGQRGRVLRLAG
jgi:hypothetical protein